MPQSPLEALLTAGLDAMKAQNVQNLDVRKLTTVTDTMIIASGTSDRHTRAIANTLVEQAKEAGFTAMGVEGKDSGEWILVDLGEVIVHIMLPRVRDFYQLEKLWALPTTTELSA